MPDWKKAKRTNKDFQPLIPEFSKPPKPLWGGAGGNKDYRELTIKGKIHPNKNSNSKGLRPGGFGGQQKQQTQPPPGFQNLDDQEAWPSLRRIPQTHMRMVSDIPDEQYAGSKNANTKLIEREENLRTHANVLAYLKQTWEDTRNDPNVVYFKVLETSSSS